MSTGIAIPSDEDGFVLLQCHICGEYFKVLAKDVNDDGNINIWCPYCGLNGKQYAPKEAIDIGLKIAQNEINELLYKTFKDLEKRTKNGIVQFKSGKKPQEEIITPIKVRINNLELIQYRCCKSVAKLYPISKMCGSYCPLCGGINYE